MPAISSKLSCSLIALTAASSAAFSSPRPISDTDAIAAASETLANPRESIRSSNSIFGLVMEKLSCSKVVRCVKRLVYRALPQFLVNWLKLSQ